MIKKLLLILIILQTFFCSPVEQDTIDEKEYSDIWYIYNKKNNYEEAITKFELFIKKYPYSYKYDNALFYCGMSYLAIGKQTSDKDKKIYLFNNSITKFAQIPSNSPQYVEALYYIAYAKDLIMNTDSSKMSKENVISAYAKVLNLFPTNNLAKLSESRIKELEK